MWIQSGSYIARKVVQRSYYKVNKRVSVISYRCGSINDSDGTRVKNETQMHQTLVPESSTIDDDDDEQPAERLESQNWRRETRPYLKGVLSKLFKIILRHVKGLLHTSHTLLGRFSFFTPRGIGNGVCFSLQMISLIQNNAGES